MEKGLLAKLNHLIFKVAVDVDFFPDTHRTLQQFILNIQGVLGDCLQLQIGTVGNQSVLSYGFAIDEFWHF